MLNLWGNGWSNKEGVGSQHKFLKVEDHNKVTFGLSYKFIGKMGGWELGVRGVQALSIE